MFFQVGFVPYQQYFHGSVPIGFNFLEPILKVFEGIFSEMKGVLPGDIVDEEGNFFGHNLKNNQMGVYIFSELHNETGTVQDLPGGQKEEHINNQQPQADSWQTHHRRGAEDPQDPGKTYRKDQHLPQP